MDQEKAEEEEALGLPLRSLPIPGREALASPSRLRPSVRAPWALPRDGRTTGTQNPHCQLSPPWRAHPPPIFGKPGHLEVPPGRCGAEMLSAAAGGGWRLQALLPASGCGTGVPAPGPGGRAGPGPGRGGRQGRARASGLKRDDRVGEGRQGRAPTQLGRAHLVP